MAVTCWLLPLVLLSFSWPFFLCCCPSSTCHQSTLLSSSILSQLHLLPVSSSIHLSFHAACDFSLIRFSPPLTPLPPLLSFLFSLHPHCLLFQLPASVPHTSRPSPSHLFTLALLACTSSVALLLMSLCLLIAHYLLVHADLLPWWLPRSSR